MEGVRNYRKNGVKVRLQIFLVSPAHYTPKLGFPDLFLECRFYTEDYSIDFYRSLFEDPHHVQQILSNV